jgi:hypothetical protein
MNSTIDTANENFITDHGSMRFRFSLARRGPRAAAPDALLRAARTASWTRAAPTAPAPPTAAPPTAVAPGPTGRAGAAGIPTGRAAGGADGTRAVAPVGALEGGRNAAVGSAPPGGCGGAAAAAGTLAVPWPGPDDLPPDRPSEPLSDPASEPSDRSGGAAMPGARVNFGDDDSPGTVARPTAARPAAVGAPPSPASGSDWVVGAPAAPDVACVSVIN